LKDSCRRGRREALRPTEQSGGTQGTSAGSAGGKPEEGAIIVTVVRSGRLWNKIMPRALNPWGAPSYPARNINARRESVAAEVRGIRGGIHQVVVLDALHKIEAMRIRDT
jgi:hypothetical protein